MLSKRYAVIDKDGKVVNHILIDDPMPKGYYPGYGSVLVPLEPVTFSKGGAGLDVITFEKLGEIPQIGDTLNLETGEVTKFVPQIITQKDENGNDIQVASAPDVKLTADTGARKTEGAILNAKVSK